MTRDEALHKLVKLRDMYEHPKTPPHEAATARAMAERLRKKFDIPVHPHAPHSDWLSDVQTRQRAAAATAAAAAHAERMRARVQAQHEWQERMASKDAMGQPLSPEDQAWAARDPLGFAQSRDKRTAQEKQRDMQNAMGKQGRKPFCDPKLSFFDVGGEPRKRNTSMMTCEMCGRLLAHGEGALYLRGYACCDTKPGPRAQKKWEDT